MKKTFKLTHPKLKLPRLVEAIKYEVRKYIARERRKRLPDGVDYWDFDCKYGADEASCETIHISTINKHISQAESEGLESFYLEVMVKPGYRRKRTDDDPQTGDDEQVSPSEEKKQ